MAFIYHNENPDDLHIGDRIIRAPTFENSK